MNLPSDAGLPARKTCSRSMIGLIDHGEQPPYGDDCPVVCRLPPRKVPEDVAVFSAHSSAQVVSADMRPLLTWLAILGYGVLALGLPLPAGMGPKGVPAGLDMAGVIAAKDRSVVFPCMNSPCGCASADQCFRACCCTTLAERLAFARRHRLDAALIASLEDRMLGAGELAEQKPQGACCASDRPAKPKGCCELERESQAPSAAAEKSCCDDAVTAESIEADPAPIVEGGRVRQVTLRAMLACKGIVTSWLAVGGAPPTPRFEITGLLPPQAWVELLDVTGLDPLLVPVPPPPWVA